MSEWTGSKLDGIEARSQAIVDVGVHDAFRSEVVVKLAAEALEVIAELRRLQEMEARLKSLMAHKRESIAKDRRIAAEEGVSWLGINSRTIAANMTDSELQNLERVLGN